MFKWLLNFLYALQLKRTWKLSFSRALRFVRRDYLLQKKVSNDLGRK